jgi:hypothetical protein
MRKTLAVLALTVASLLLLASPSWSFNDGVRNLASQAGTQHHLYRINKTNSYEALTDCPANVKIQPRSGVAFVPTKREGTKAYSHITAKRYVFNTTEQFSKSSVKATCDKDPKPMINSSNLLSSLPPQALARTGRLLVPQLAIGIGLLLVGILLVVGTVRRPVTRRG